MDIMEAEKQQEAQREHNICGYGDVNSKDIKEVNQGVVPMIKNGKISIAMSDREVGKILDNVTLLQYLWGKPDRKKLKCNTDGASRENPSIRSFSFVFGMKRLV